MGTIAIVFQRAESTVHDWRRCREKELKDDESVDSEVRTLRD
jgi:hypothetical protein